MPPVLRGEMLLDRMGGQARLNYEQLRKDALDLELQIKQLQVRCFATCAIVNYKLFLSSANEEQK